MTFPSAVRSNERVRLRTGTLYPARVERLQGGGGGREGPYTGVRVTCPPLSPARCRRQLRPRGEGRHASRVEGAAPASWPVRLQANRQGAITNTMLRGCVSWTLQALPSPREEDDDRAILQPAFPAGPFYILGSRTTKRDIRLRRPPGRTRRTRKKCLLPRRAANNQRHGVCTLEDQCWSVHRCIRLAGSSFSLL